MSEALYLMSPIEIVRGAIVGHVGELPPPTDPGATARQALEAAVLPAVRRAPCAVAFSGGRDSSLVLAVATHVARREGLPDPVPVTRVFPDVVEAEEHEWQEEVVRHLGLSEWVRTTIHDELDVVGALAAEHLLAHGVVWPPTIAGYIPLVEPVRGGSLMDGEGGDEVLGVAAHRVAPLTRLVRAPRPVRWRRIRGALSVFAPQAEQRRIVHHRWQRWPTPWLRPAVRESLIDAVAQYEGDRPLSFARSVRRVPSRRTQVLGRRNRDIFAAAYDVDCSSPLLHPDVAHALAREGGVLGRGDRTTVLRSLAADLLPAAVLARTSKASFTKCYMGQPLNEFATTWDGAGVDHDLVDAEALRAAWLADEPVALTAALAQSAWLATHGPPAGRPPSATRLSPTEVASDEMT